MITAQEYYEEIRQKLPLPSGNSTLDALLKGGIITGPMHLLFGPAPLLSPILMQTAVNALLPTVDGGWGAKQVAYVDGVNHFNPYFVSKLAVMHHLGPTDALKRILISRTFTFNQMVEVLEEKIAVLDSVDLVLVDGMTAMFEETAAAAPARSSAPYSASSPTSNSANPAPQDLNSKAYQNLNRMFSGLKVLLRRCNPAVILTGPLHSKSQFRPAGGRLLSHFAGIIIGVHDTPRYIDYSLDQHPFLPFSKQRYWKPLEQRLSPAAKRGHTVEPQNLTLDAFFPQ